MLVVTAFDSKKLCGSSFIISAAAQCCRYRRFAFRSRNFMAAFGALAAESSDVVQELNASTSSFFRPAAGAARPELTARESSSVSTAIPLLVAGVLRVGTAGAASTLILFVTTLGNGTYKIRCREAIR